ncbi:tyrosine-type recombinase/integrase [Streptomyces sp. NPDC020192]|uniref:tyrosine-type recombinase/integrase n=1 Tax=Streptomyces sp. NPDC020192 TaxID=3365066 RepID=UPI0037BBB30E
MPRLERKIAGEHWSQAPDHDLIFSSEHGGLIDPVGFSRTFERLVKRAGVRRITVRPARHTCGTLLALREAVGMLAELLEDPLIG